jgi:N-acetylmuramoyl-L-alanine amidase
VCSSISTRREFSEVFILKRYLVFPIFAVVALFSAAHIFANITVSFPSQNQKLPYVEKTYFIGATDPSSDAFLYINGVTTTVYKTGAFITMLDVKPGTNTVIVFKGRDKITRKFVVAPKPSEVAKKEFVPVTVDDERLGKICAWKTTGDIFANRVSALPDGGDTYFFLPQGFVISGCEFKGVNKILVFAEDKCGFISRSSLEKCEDVPVPSKSIIVPDPAIGFPAHPPYDKKPEDVCICIDPGHGGSDAGAISPHGWKEKDFNLMQARAIREELEKAGFQVIMTRDGDSFPSLLSRPRKAFKNKADAFISVHHNATAANRDPRLVRHTTTYASLSNGLALASSIQKYVGQVMAPVKDNGAQMKSLAVCRNPAVPSCLLEVDFINLPEGEADSMSAKRRNLVAKAVVLGILDWMMEKPASYQE